MNWLWFAIILAAGLAVCAGIYREQCEREAPANRHADLEYELREAHAAEYITDSIKRFHWKENRAEYTALWNEQYALIRGGMIGDFADWYVGRLWHRNREHWGWIIAAKGRIEPDEVSA